MIEQAQQSECRYCVKWIDSVLLRKHLAIWKEDGYVEYGGLKVVSTEWWPAGNSHVN